MKKLIYFSIALTGLLITSCASNNKDEDTITPSTDAREKYVAYWNVSEYSAVVNGTSTHTVNIIKSPSNSSEIIINNFSGLSVSARASVSNNNLTIPFQQIGSPNPIGFTQGSGTFNGSNSIVFTYTTTISTSRDSCSATYTK